MHDFDLFSSRRILYPPWRILLYLTFQERTLMMVLGLLLAAKEKLIGIYATLNKHTIYQMHLWMYTNIQACVMHLWGKPSCSVVMFT